VLINQDGDIVVDAPQADVNINAKNINAKATNNATVDANSVKIKAATTLEISGMAIKFTRGTLTVDGIVAPTGQGGFCAVAICPLTGLFHVGSTIALGS
jgi:hypothetical protein